MINVGTIVLVEQNRRLTLCLAQNEARELLAQIRGFLQDTRRGEIIRSGIRLTIFGPPNAGKSSLLNFLGSYVFRSLVGRHF